MNLTKVRDNLYVPGEEKANRYKYIDEEEQHLHTLDGKPLIGASTAKGIIGKKDNLFQYYADRAAVCALGLPENDITEEYERIQAMTDWRAKKSAMEKLIKQHPDFGYARLAANRHRDGAAKTGTKRHGELEEYVKDCIEFNEGNPDWRSHMDAIELNPDVKMFRDWACENVEKFYFTEANCYHEGLWVGGIADLGLKLKDGRRVVCDHKSSKAAYSDQFLQCALYDTLLSHSGGLDKDGNRLFDWEPADGYIVFPFRSQPFTPEFRWNADEWRKAAEYTAFLYKLMEINN